MSAIVELELTVKRLETKLCHEAFWCIAIQLVSDLV